MQSNFGLEVGRFGFRIHGTYDLLGRFRAVATLPPSPHIAMWDHFRAELNALIELANEIPGGFVVNHVRAANGEEEPLYFKQDLENLMTHLLNFFSVEDEARAALKMECINALENLLDALSIIRQKNVRPEQFNALIAELNKIEAGNRPTKDLLVNLLGDMQGRLMPQTKVEQVVRRMHVLLESSHLSQTKKTDYESYFNTFGHKIIYLEDFRSINGTLMSVLRVLRRDNNLAEIQTLIAELRAN